MFSRHAGGGLVSLPPSCLFFSLVVLGFALRVYALSLSLICRSIIITGVSTTQRSSAVISHFLSSFTTLVLLLPPF